MSCTNPPNAEQVFFIDTLGIPITCTKKDNKYVCSKVVYGRVPVLDNINGQNCSWKLCDINLVENKINFDSCKDTSYPYYVTNEGDGCSINNLKDSTDKKTMNSDCCCNPTQRCDSVNCCQKVAGTCPYDNFKGKFFNVGYLNQQKRSYTCMTVGGAKACVPIPDDYDQNPNFYPEIQEAVQKTGRFASSICDCIQDNEACSKNVTQCLPKPDCVACNPQIKAGDYICDKGQCKLDPGNGVYRTSDECLKECSAIQTKYSCNNGTCQENPDGIYFSPETCQDACQELVSSPMSYNIRQKVFNTLIIIALIFGILILLIILFYVFIFIKNRIKKSRG